MVVISGVSLDQDKIQNNNSSSIILVDLKIERPSRNSRDLLERN